MGYRDNPELTPSDAELADAEASMRTLLGRFGEPAPVEPPPDLASRIIAALPDARRPSRPLWQRSVTWVALAAAALLVALAGWLRFRLAPSNVAGIPSSVLGQLGDFSHGFTPAPSHPSAFGSGLGLGLLIVVLLISLGLGLWWYRTRRR